MPTSLQRLLVPCGALLCSPCHQLYSNSSTVQKGHRSLLMARRLFQSGHWNLATSFFILIFCRLVDMLQKCSCFPIDWLSLELLCLNYYNCLLCLQGVRMSDLSILCGLLSMYCIIVTLMLLCTFVDPLNNSQRHHMTPILCCMHIKLLALVLQVWLFVYMPYYAPGSMMHAKSIICYVYFWTKLGYRYIWYCFIFYSLYLCE